MLLARSVHDRYYFLPGGHIEEGEGPQDALVREIKEELDIEIKATELIFVKELENSWVNKRGENHEINYIYKLSLQEKFNPISQEDHLDFEWKSIDLLNQIDLRPKQITEVIQKLVL